MARLINLDFILTIPVLFVRRKRHETTISPGLTVSMLTWPLFFDLSAYLDAARLVAAGQDPYAATRAAGVEQWGQYQVFLSPPFVAHVLAPFDGVQVAITYIVWTVTSLAVLLGAMRLVDPGIELVACGSSGRSMSTFAAWEAGDRSPREWRVHIHVPVFLDDLGAFRSTRDSIEAALAVHKARPLSPQLEIETYTWDMLPDEIKTGDIVEYVCREIEWVRGELVPAGEEESSLVGTPAR